MTCAKCSKEIRHNAGFLCHFVRWSAGWGSSRIYSFHCPSGGYHEEVQS